MASPPSRMYRERGTVTLPCPISKKRYGGHSFLRYVCTSAWKGAHSRASLDDCRCSQHEVIARHLRTGWDIYAVGWMILATESAAQEGRGWGPEGVGWVITELLPLVVWLGAWPSDSAKAWDMGASTFFFCRPGGGIEAWEGFSVVLFPCRLRQLGVSSVSRRSFVFLSLAMEIGPELVSRTGSY